jgi:PAS domain S-box-containing protein
MNRFDKLSVRFEPPGKPMQNDQRPFTFSNRDSQLAGKFHNAKPRARVPLLWLLSPIVVIAIYLVDLWMPAHLTIPIYYVATLVILVAVPGSREKLLIAGVCTALLLIDFYLQSRNPTGPAWAQAVSHGLAIIMIWSVTTLGLRHRRVEERLRDNQRIANERLALIDTIYASAPVGLCFVDRELRYVSVNNALAEMDGHTPDFYLGKSVRDAAPELAEVIEAHHHRVIESGQPVVDVEVVGTSRARPNEQRYWLCSYFPVRNDTGDLLGVNVAVRDITRRKQAEANALFLLDVGECIRFAADGDELLRAVAVALGEHLPASRCVFIRIDCEQDRVVVQRDYHPHVTSLVGNYSLSALAPAIVAAGRLGQTIVVGDVSRDPRTAEFVDAHRRLGVSAYVAAPLVRDGQLTSAIVVAMAQPHEWNEREVALVNLVAERTWEAVEKLQLDAALRESDAALRDADRRKDEFLATLAHELRNPLSLMRNVVTLQQTSGAPHTDPQWGKDIIERQVNYLTRLTDDLFDVSRITREKLNLQKETLNLSEVIKAAVESCRPLIEQRRHELVVIMSPEAIYVDADRVRLTQVFMNLLNNAAKYTPDAGHIWLNVEPAGDTVEVRIKDTGLGIAPENLPRLFELFYQVDRSFTRSEGGLGLGLTLVHRLVEMHGGKVEARSAGVNRGSEFIVRLPVLENFSHTVESAVVKENSALAPTRCRRILVADDFPQSAETLAQLLRREGFEVRVAQDGIEAFQTAAEFRPDVIVLDIAMPKLNGYEAARKIREQPWGKEIILIALTGWGQQQDRRRTQDAGFNAHLTKPVNYSTIMELLANVPGTVIGGANQNLTQ